MPTLLASLRRASILTLLMLVAACGGGGGGGGSTDNPTPGTLSLSVSGVPAGINAVIVISGPDGFNQPLLSTQGTITNLVPGTYTVTANSVLAGDTIFAPGQSTQTIAISGGAVANVAVVYTAEAILRLSLQPVVTGLSSPVFLTAPAGDPRLFIVERAGRVRVVRDGILLPTPFLDITTRVGTAGEGGLLSIAFDPQYAANGFVFAYFTESSGDIAIERFRVSTDDPDRADATPLRILTIPHRTFTNHKGGLIAFGPDGFLYAGTGDGGGGGDPLGNGQNRNTLLGALLRIDVSNASTTQPYAIPPQNPFIGQLDRRGEIWAFGLRNPWRYAFDAATSLIYIADVGQSRREEVNIAPTTSAGLNYGWNVTEGSLCFPGDPCNTQGQTLPVLEYPHDASGGCSIIGGFVYRGSAMPELRGRYFYSDLCSGFLRSFVAREGAATEQVDWRIASPGLVVSFGEDGWKELHVMTEGGTVFRVIRQSGGSNSTGADGFENLRK